MNKPRRKQIQNIIQQLEKLQEDIQLLNNGVEQIKDDEEEYRDNVPENLQGTERYEKAELACDALESAICELDEISDSINETIMYLNDASE